MNLYTKIYLILLTATLIVYAARLPAKKYHESLIALLLAVWLITTIAAIGIILYAADKNNLFIFHISTPVEYTILSVLYANAIVSKRGRKIILYSVPVFVLLSILSGLYIQGFQVNNSNMVVLESILLVGWSLFFLREVLILQQVQSLVHYPLFWVSVAILFYYIGNLVIEGMLNYLIRHSMEMARTTYRIGYIFKYLLFGLFIGAAFCTPKKAAIKE